MAVWEVVKGLKPDFSQTPPETLNKIVENLSSEDIQEILEEIEEQRSALQIQNEALNFAISLGKAALGKLL